MIHQVRAVKRGFEGGQGGGDGRTGVARLCCLMTLYRVAADSHDLRETMMQRVRLTPKYHDDRIYLAGMWTHIVTN